jgi:hypothetical protein
MALVSVAGGLALRFAFAGLLGATVPYITLFPAVMFAAWFGGLGPGIVAMALSLVATFGLIIPPYFLLPTNSADAIGAAMFVAVSLLISALNEALRGPEPLPRCGCWS